MPRPSTSRRKTKSSEKYVEIRLPEVTRTTLLVIIPLVLFSFAAGMLTMKSLAEGLFGPPQDAMSAFKNYAKTLKLNTSQFNSCLSEEKYLSRITTDRSEGAEADVTATPTVFINGTPVIGAQPYSVFKAVIEGELTGVAPTSEPEATPAPKQTVTRGTLPIRGKEDSKVEIVLFSDFQCPFCKRFYDNAMPEILKEYVDTGKAVLTFRHFPLTDIHPNAETAHLASECANEQGKFWEYHNVLFENQDEWKELPLQKKS